MVLAATVPPPIWIRTQTGVFCGNSERNSLTSVRVVLWTQSNDQVWAENGTKSFSAIFGSPEIELTIAQTVLGHFYVTTWHTSSYRQQLGARMCQEWYIYEPFIGTPITIPILGEWIPTGSWVHKCAKNYAQL